MPAESRSEPGTVTGASDCEPVLVDESMEEPTSFLSDCSLPIGGRSCDQTSAENSPSDEDDTLFDAEDGDEDSREIELEKMMKLCFKCWVCMQTNTNSQYHTTISWKKKQTNIFIAKFVYGKLPYIKSKVKCVFTFHISAVKAPTS